MALVVGNDVYPDARLSNAVNDARALAQALRALRFETQLETNVSLREFTKAVDGLAGRVDRGVVALFYYSGHGLQVEGENYLVPVDFAATDAADVPFQGYPVGRIQSKLAGAGARLAIIVLDACRNNPFRGVRATYGGWVGMQAGGGSFLAFATAPGATASDNPAGGNVLFTSHLLDVLREPGLKLDDVFARVGERVRAASHGRQDPWVTSSAGIGSWFVMRPGTPVSASPELPQSTGAPLDVTGDWDLVDTIEQTTYRPFQGLQLGYRLTLRQSGTRIDGVGRKVTENGRDIPASARSPMTITGIVEGRALRLTYEEVAAKRVVKGAFTLTIDGPGLSMSGFFVSDAAGSSGSCVARRVVSR